MMQLSAARNGARRRANALASATRSIFCVAYSLHILYIRHADTHPIALCTTARVQHAAAAAAAFAMLCQSATAQYTRSAYNAAC